MDPELPHAAATNNKATATLLTCADCVACGRNDDQGRKASHIVDTVVECARSAEMASFAVPVQIGPVTAKSMVMSTGRKSCSSPCTGYQTALLSSRRYLPDRRAAVTRVIGMEGDGSA